VRARRASRIAAQDGDSPPQPFSFMNRRVAIEQQVDVHARAHTHTRKLTNKQTKTGLPISLTLSLAISLALSGTTRTSPPVYPSPHVDTPTDPSILQTRPCRASVFTDEFMDGHGSILGACIQ
jgi:hypothetical protein